MADLMTRIGADDSEFHRKMDSMDRRITGFARDLKGSLRGVREMFAGFGVSQIVGGISEVADKILAIQKEQTDELNRQIDAARTRNSAHADFRRSLGGELTLAEKVTRQQVANLDAIARAKKESADKITNEGKMDSVWSAVINSSGRDLLRRLPSLAASGASPGFGFGMFAEGLIQDDKSRRLRDLMKTAGTDASIEVAQSAKDLRTAALKMISDDAKRSSAIVRERAGNLIAGNERRAESRRSLADTLADERVSAMRDAGDNRGAELEQNRLRYMRMRREIVDSTAINEEDRWSAIGALSDREKLAAAAIERRAQEGFAASAPSINGAVGVGGATFRQQMGLLNAPLQSAAEKQVGLLGSVDGRLKTLVDKLPSSQYSTYN